MAELNTNTDKSLSIEVVGRPIKQLILNNDQLKALEYYENWFSTTKNAKDDRLIKKLTGAAGTGKTTLISAILNLSKVYFRSHKVCICAPTHKAKSIIENKTKWGSCETIQALLGLKLDTSIEDFDVNNPAFNPIGERKINDYDLVVIDESSMVNSQLYTTIVDNAIQVGCHVLFAGDIMQLNPVKEYGISPSLLTPDGYELTEIVRQNKTNPLLFLLGILRDDIRDNTNNYLEYLINNPHNISEGIGGYQMLDRKAFASKMNNLFSSELFKEDRNFCRYIAWTNNSIQDVNKHIRNEIFKYIQPLTIGELLLAYKTVKEPKRDITSLVNSDDYIVEEVNQTYDTDYKLDILSVKLKGLDTNKSSVVSIVLPEQKNLDRFKEIHDNFLNKAIMYRGKAWKNYFGFKDKYLIIGNIYEELSGYNPKVAVKKDLDYGYGITTHKSQGSTYNTIFVNGKDILLNKNEAERRRLFYVALSRASNEAYIVMR